MHAKASPAPAAAEVDGRHASASRRRDALLLALIALVDLALHVGLSGRYGYWIDELYFIACGDHLDWGYVDHPPLIAGVAWLSRAVGGDSLYAIRFLPALSAAALVFLTGSMARALGGGRRAQVIAAVATVAAPVYLLFGGVLTMNAFEPLFWMGCALLTIRLARGAAPRWWLAIGVVVGIGLLNKHSMAFFTAALLAGLLVSPQRRLLATFWMLPAVAVAALIALPHLLWQIGHGWPTLELLANAHRYQHQPVTPLEFVWGQIQIVQPVSLPLWMAGLYFLLRSAAGLRVRFLGWTFVVLFLAFMWIQAKTYYLAPAYPLLFAAGGVAVERAAAHMRRQWLVPTAIALLVLGGLITAPYVLPILPVAALPTYLQWLGMKEVRSETRPMGQVPQIFADMLGWDELVAEVARVYQGLTPAERAHATLWGAWYGAAGAIDYFGGRYGLPHAVSGHQNYYLWGPGDGSGELIIAVGFSTEQLAPWCESLTLAGEVRCDYCMPDRAVQRIHLCRNLKMPLAQFWPLTRCWTCDRPPFLKQPPPTP